MNIMRWLQFVVLFVWFSKSSAKLHPNVEGIYGCNVPNHKWSDTLSVDIIYVNNAVVAFITLPFPIDSSITYSLKTIIYKDGKWLPGALAINGSVCEVFTLKEPIAFQKLAKGLGVKHQCPIPAGKYKMQQFQLSTDDVAIDRLFKKGDFLIEITLYKDKIPIVCKQIEIIITDMK